MQIFFRIACRSILLDRLVHERKPVGGKGWCVTQTHSCPPLTQAVMRFLIPAWGVPFLFWTRLKRGGNTFLIWTQGWIGLTSGGHGDCVGVQATTHVHVTCSIRLLLAKPTTTPISVFFLFSGAELKILFFFPWAVCGKQYGLVLLVLHKRRG